MFLLSYLNFSKSWQINFTTSEKPQQDQVLGHGYGRLPRALTTKSCMVRGWRCLLKTDLGLSLNGVYLGIPLKGTFNRENDV